MNPLQKFENALLEPILNKMLELAMNYERDLGCMEVAPPKEYYNFETASNKMYYEECDKAEQACKAVDSAPLFKTKREKLEYLACKRAGDAQKEKETTMRNDISLNVASAPIRDADQEARDHLLSRLSDIFRTKDTALEEKYFINSPKGPDTLGELKDRIAKGLFTIDSNGYNDDAYIRYHGLDSFISWRAKGQEKDQAGYDKARKALKAKREATKDIIYTTAPADGLKALQEFESASIK